MSRLIPLQEGIVYGPVRSKRLGRSLGINLFPADRKVCSFDCVYCHFGPTTEHVGEYHDTECRSDKAPTVNAVLSAVEGFLKSDCDFDYVTLSGNGEPTMYPEFARLVPGMKELILRYRPAVRLALLSNSSTVSNEALVPALALIDVPIFKLDAGDQATFEVLNQPCPGIKIAEIINGLARLAAQVKLTIQTVMVKGPVWNSEGAPFAAWLAAVKKIKPVRIQLYTTDRPVADLRVQKLSDERLDEIAEKVRALTGIETKAYY